MHSMFINIKDLNTMKLPAMANVFNIQNLNDIPEFFKQNINEKEFILGGGSNLIIQPIRKKTYFKN